VYGLLVLEYLTKHDAQLFPRVKRAGTRGMGLLALAGVVALGAWWMRRAAVERDLSIALSHYAGAPLPRADAPVDQALADLGAGVFKARCTACHALTGDEKLGPNLGAVTRRRELPWIRSMILRPDSMTASDPTASELKARYGVQMLITGEMTDQHALAVVEFLRRADQGGDG